jgi:DnaJ-class molecular chaperone
MKDYYELLGIEPSHPQEAIAQAFRNKIRGVHPDKCQLQDNLNHHKEATIQLYEAYKVLNDPAARRDYDELLKYRQQSHEISTNRYFEEANIV